VFREQPRHRLVLLETGAIESGLAEARSLVDVRAQFDQNARGLSESRCSRRVEGEPAVVIGESDVRAVGREQPDELRMFDRVPSE
jgi:hypothetical protein